MWWDNSATTYDTSGHQITTDKEKEAWKQELRKNLVSPPLCILDVGCGTGIMSLLLSDLGYQVNGVDISRVMLKKARMNAEESNFLIPLIQGDAENLPFHNEQFDVIINRHLIWTLTSPKIALQDWYRVFKKGGRIIVIDDVWNDGRFSTLVKRWISNRLVRIFEPEDAHHHLYLKNIINHLPHDGGVPPERIQKCLENVGFSDISFRNLTYIRTFQTYRIPWYRRISLGNRYYILTAFK